MPASLIAAGAASAHDKVQTGALPAQVQLDPVAARALAYAVATSLVQGHDLPGAKAYLAEHLRTDPADSSCWNLLGLVNRDLGESKEAEEAFTNAAARATGELRAAYLYNAADTANRRGHAERTREFLDQSQSASAPAGGAIGAQIASWRNVIEAGRPLPELREISSSKLRLRGSLGLQSGYATNALLLPDSSNGSPSPGSWYEAPRATIELESPLAGGKLVARSATSFTAYMARIARPYNNLFESASAEWAPASNEEGRTKLFYGDRFDFSAVNSAGLLPFSWTNALYGKADYKIDELSSASFELPVGYQKFMNVTLQSAADDRSGYSIGPVAIYRRTVGEVSLRGGLSYQAVLGAGSNYVSNALQGLAGAARDLPWKMKGSVGFGLTRTWYPQSLSSRADTLFNTSAKLSKPLPFDENFLVALDYIYGSNDSTIDAASYQQSTVFLEVSYAFR